MVERGQCPALSHEIALVEIKDKIVVINWMYADCEGVRQLITANLVKVQK